MAQVPMAHVPEGLSSWGPKFRRALVQGGPNSEGPGSEGPSSKGPGSEGPCSRGPWGLIPFRFVSYSYCYAISILYIRTTSRNRL